MKIFNISLVLLLWATLLSAQLDSMGMVRLGVWDDNTLDTRADGQQYNDIWGYAAPNGDEFAIIGSLEYIHFIDITDPYNPVEVARFAGGASSTSSCTIWRDMKTYGEYAYACSECSSEGLMIFDLSDISNGNVTKVLQTSAFFGKAHNIYIDTAEAKLYGIGSNTRSNGLNIIDLSVNPANPTSLANPVMDGGYSHDVFVRNDTAYCSHGTASGKRFQVYDVSTPATPILLGSLGTYPEQGYNHSSWLTDDGDHVVMCDETHGTAVKMVDVSDLTDITVVDLFESDLIGNSGSIVHNSFIKGDSVYLSYYHDGIVVFNIEDPTNVTLAAYYDTNPDNTTYSGYEGVWGVYPYLPSGNIIGSDDKYGLQVISFLSALPVELVDFSVKKIGAKAQINWATLSEQNNAHFIIERSTDGVSFQAIEKVAGAINSSDRIAYQAWDSAPFAGINYYRLKQVDIDGKFEYSDIKAVDFEDKASINIFPTRTQKGQSIQLSIDATQSDLLVQVFDIAGKKWMEQSVSAGTTNLSTSNWPVGTYIVEVSNAQTQFAKKVLVME